MNDILPNISSHIIHHEHFDTQHHTILTDNYAPIEHLTADLLKHSDDYYQNGETMMKHIAEQLSFGARYVGSSGHAQVQQHLYDQFSEYTDNTSFQAFNYFGKPDESYNLKNIIARFNPDSNNRIVLGSHYDAKKYAYNNPQGEFVPGANDSASGVALLLMLAEDLASGNHGFDYGIDIVLFDGEEGDPEIVDDYTDWQPLGSQYFAENIFDIYSETKPKEAIIFDMVCDKDLKLKPEYHSIGSHVNGVSKFWSLGKNRYPRTFSLDVSEAIHDDHIPLLEIGIPSFLVIDFDYDAFHSVDDTIAHCSAQSLQQVYDVLIEYLNQR